MMGVMLNAIQQGCTWCFVKEGMGSESNFFRALDTKFISGELVWHYTAAGLCPH